MRKKSSLLPHTQGLRKRARSSRVRREERGSVAVEFAFSFPLVLVVFMVMMFLMDVMMVKQEITNVGFTAMRECAGAEGAPEACVLSLITQAQQLPGSNARYSCEADGEAIANTPGTVFYAVNLNCEYQGFKPINSIFDIIGVDLDELTEIEVQVFFPASS